MLEDKHAIYKSASSPGPSTRMWVVYCCKEGVFYSQFSFDEAVAFLIFCMKVDGV